MKKISIALSTCAVLFICLSLTGSYKNTEITARIQPVKMNVAYIGVENPIAVYTTGVDPKTVEVTVTEGTIRAIPNGKYVAEFDSTLLGHTVTVTVIRKTRGKEIRIADQILRIKEVPLPQVWVHNYRFDSYVQPEMRKELRAIFLRLESFDFECSTMVKSFTFSVCESGNWIDYYGHGPGFTNEMCSKIYSATPGTRIMIHNVVAIMPGGVVRKCGGINMVLR